MTTRDRPPHFTRFLTPTDDERRLGLVCLGVGTLSGPLPAVRDRTLDCYAAVLVLAGRGRLTSSAQVGVADVGSPGLFWLAPGVSHTYVRDSDDWAEMWVLFEGEAASAYEDLGFISREHPAVPLGDPLPVRGVFDRLFAACERPEMPATTTALVHELVVTVRRSEMSGPAERRRSILSALADRACAPVSLAEQARQLGLSPDALREEVLRGAGCTPKEFVLRVRLSKAKSLLAESDLAISQVARAVGYDDAAYFSRLFARRVGMAPRVFRRQQPFTT